MELQKGNIIGPTHGFVLLHHQYVDQIIIDPSVLMLKVVKSKLQFTASQ